MPRLINEQLGGIGRTLHHLPGRSGDTGDGVESSTHCCSTLPDGVGARADRLRRGRLRGARAGRGALLRAEQPDGSTTGTIYLVTDQGMKFPIADDDALAALGYDDVTPDEVPRTLLDVIPTGPSLDPAAARVSRDAPERIAVRARSVRAKRAASELAELRER